MDKKHIFGSFSEAFDLMRSELKKARINEKKANDAKKEIVAKLSHDIKTPLSAIELYSKALLQSFSVSKQVPATGMCKARTCTTRESSTMICPT